MSVQAPPQATSRHLGRIAEGGAWLLILALAAIFVVVVSSGSGNGTPDTTHTAPAAVQKKEVVIGHGSPAFRTNPR